MNKPISRCCEARANVNVRDGGYLCSSCGKDCEVAFRHAGLTAKTYLSATRKPTGERQLFVELWAKCKGKSEVGGEKLLPPEHPQFHFQGSHLLPKGTYPDYRLDERNVVMMTVEEHETWHREPKGWLLSQDKWAPIVRRYDALKAEAYRRGKFVDVEGSGNDIVQLSGS